MISKRHLLEMICDLASELDTIHLDIEALEREVKKIKTANVGAPNKERKPGRPKKTK